MKAKLIILVLVTVFSVGDASAQEGRLLFEKTGADWQQMTKEQKDELLKLFMGVSKEDIDQAKISKMVSCADSVSQDTQWQSADLASLFVKCSFQTGTGKTARHVDSQMDLLSKCMVDKGYDKHDANLIVGNVVQVAFQQKEIISDEEEKQFSDLNDCMEKTNFAEKQKEFYEGNK